MEDVSLVKIPADECYCTYWRLVNNGSGNGLVPSGNKPLPEPMLTNIDLRCHMASLSHRELKYVLLCSHQHACWWPVACLPGAIASANMVMIKFDHAYVRSLRIGPGRIQEIKQCGLSFLLITTNTCATSDDKVCHHDSSLFSGLLGFLGESTVKRFPLQRASNAEMVSMWW